MARNRRRNLKLRIRGNAIRLRLQSPEVERLQEYGKVIETTCFGGAIFQYVLELDASLILIQADLEAYLIRIRIPSAQAQTWASSTEISLYGEQPSATGPLTILIEKDFACIKPRTSAQWEDDSGAYPNPHPSCGDKA